MPHLRKSLYLCTSAGVLDKYTYYAKDEKRYRHEILSYIKARLKVQRLNPLTHWDIQVIREEVYKSSLSSLAFKDIHTVESVFQFVYTCPGQIKSSLDQAIL